MKVQKCFQPLVCASTLYFSGSSGQQDGLLKAIALDARVERLLCPLKLRTKIRGTNGKMVKNISQGGDNATLRAIMGIWWYISLPRKVSAMPKQVHLRIDDGVYENLSVYSSTTNQTIQDCISIAVRQMLAKAKQEPAQKAHQYSFIDFFAGIGGMHIAYETADCQCVYSNEWNKYCQETYYANFGVQPYGDITKVDAQRDIPDHDILVAGFPCQPFSIAGVSKKKSLGRETGFEDKTQGTLFFDICRILNAKRPKAFMLENVKNLRSHDKGKTFAVILESLEELDYSISYAILDGQKYVPQHRERIVIIGFDRRRYGPDVRFDFELAPLEYKPILGDILEQNVSEKYTLSDKLWQYLKDYAAKHKEAGNGFGYGIAPLDGITRTLSARYYKDGSEILIAQSDKNPRRLTPRECARLQGFPDSFKIPVSDTQAYKQFGNSVVVPLMTDVAKLVVRKLQNLDGSIV